MYLFLVFFLIRVGAGSRWHSSGLVGAFKPSLAQVNLAQSSIRLLKELESRGRPTGWKQCGSLLLARTRDRMTVYRRMKSQSVYVFFLNYNATYSGYLQEELIRQGFKSNNLCMSLIIQISILL